MQGFEHLAQAFTAGEWQVAGLRRRKVQLVQQHLDQALVAFVLGHLEIALGEVAEDGLENIADHQGAGLLGQVLAQLAGQVHRTVDDRLGL